MYLTQGCLTTLFKYNMLLAELLPSFDEITKTLSAMTRSDTKASSGITFSADPIRRKQYCRAHLNRAISLNETAEKDYSFCRMLRSNDDVFMKVLSEAQAR